MKQPAIQTVENMSHVRRQPVRSAFTLIEMVSAIAVLSLLILMISSVFMQAQRGWLVGSNRAQTFSTARMILDGIANDLQQVLYSPDILFHGTETELHFVIATKENPAIESADLAEVGYEFKGGTGIWAIERKYTGPIGPTGVSGPPPPNPVYQLFSILPENLSAVDAMAQNINENLGFEIVINEPIEIVAIGVFDYLGDGIKAGSSGPRFHFWSNPYSWSYYFTIIPDPPSTNGPSSGLQIMPGEGTLENGYRFRTIPAFLVQPGRYNVGACTFHGANRAVRNNAVLPLRVFNSGMGAISFILPKINGGCDYPGQTDVANVAASFKFRRPSSGGSGSGSGPEPNTIPGGNWNVYANNWWNTFDSTTVVASNTVVGCQFSYISANGTESSSWNNSEIPRAVRVSLVMLDTRAATQVSSGGSFEGATNMWGRTFSSVISLTNVRN